ncbi:hypothetical protein CRUP_007474 [Coryphaenoides rupestris]|nr:hypothetical protein CRUP_007474 [Coryphaenoides rupestris]
MARHTAGYVTEVCHVPCPLDCKLSAWTAWTACSAPCGGGLKFRSKWLREKAFNGGRPCPRLDMKNQNRKRTKLQPAGLSRMVVRGRLRPGRISGSITTPTI